MHQTPPESCEIKNQLLLDAMDQVGVCSPVAAACVFAAGVKNRNAAMQYAVMNARLKAESAQRWQTTAPNWVTGVSSPWIDSFRIVREKCLNPHTRAVELLFSTATSTGLAGEYQVTLRIGRGDGFWRICRIKADEEFSQVYL